ncbi:Protein K09E9.1 [Aphelenchoides avenae]|nr:Protein K09E9.1 [Aphelenchus avenae]
MASVKLEATQEPLLESAINSETIGTNAKDVSEKTERDFGVYQLVLFAVTQIGYFPVAASMLSTTFFEANADTCRHLTRHNNGSGAASEALRSRILQTEFQSLLLEWQEECRASPLQVAVSSSVMAGAVFGAFCSGFLADRFGRKPAVVGAMLLLSLCNLLLVGIAAFSWHLALVLFFLLGCASGGYMVTNMVLIIEALENARSRLLVVSLNGWPLGLVYTAVVGYATQEWRYYHLIVAASAALTLIVLHLFSLESVRWLTNRNKLLRADKVRLIIHERNYRCRPLSPSRALIDMNANYAPKSTRDHRPRVSLTSQNSTVPSNGTSSVSSVASGAVVTSTYTYLDLFRHAEIAVPLAALLYCFMSSSVVSFGLYFSAEALPGDRFLNIGIMGAGKFVLGFLPFVVSYCVGRKPIVLVSLGVATLCSWGILATAYGLLPSTASITTVLGLVVTASMDPTWKIIHLYSMELFPTAVRNMSRGLCNVVARLGSLSGPWIAFLHSYNPHLPFWIFALLLTGQWLIALLVLPETRNRPLPEGMPGEQHAAVGTATQDSSRPNGPETETKLLVEKC